MFITMMKFKKKNSSRNPSFFLFNYEFWFHFRVWMLNCWFVAVKELNEKKLRWKKWQFLRSAGESSKDRAVSSLWLFRARSTILPQTRIAKSQRWKRSCKLSCTQCWVLQEKGVHVKGSIKILLHTKTALNETKCFIYLFLQNWLWLEEHSVCRHIPG